MLTISATEANRRFSYLLRMVAMGEEVIILARGKPLAKITRIEGDSSDRKEAHARLMERLKNQPSLPDVGPWRREELYEDSKK